MSSRITDRELLAYAAGELHGAEAARIEAHLKTDPEARATVARYQAAREALRSDEAQATPPDVVARAKAIFSKSAPRPLHEWLQSVQSIVARLVFDSRLAPALAGFRGGSEQFQVSWESDEAEIEIEGALVAIGSRPGAARRWQLTGQISPVSPARQIGVALVRPGTREAVVMADADESGMFTFEAPADRYDLMVRLDEEAVVIVVPDLELR